MPRREHEYTLDEIIAMRSRVFQGMRIGVKETTNLGVVANLGNIDSNGDLQFATDTNGVMPFKEQGLLTSTTTSAAGVATASVVATGDWEVYSVLASMDADANAGNRVLSIAIAKYVDATGANADLFNSDGVTCSANQWGSVWMFQALGGCGLILLNDNGTRSWTAAETNIVPIMLRSGELIEANFTNEEAGDICSCTVWYREGS